MSLSDPIGDMIELKMLNREVIKVELPSNFKTKIADIEK